MGEAFPSEIRKQVKYLALFAKKASLALSGVYRSHLHGDGMIFSEFREYVYGDDVRHISWPMTAKWDRPIVKKFEQERQTPIILALDVSASLDYGTTKYTKKEVSSHLAALLGMCAEQNKDPVGLLLFSDQIEKYRPPKESRGQLLKFLFDFLSCERKSKKTSLRGACEFLQKSLNKKSVIFLVSDFLDEEFDMSLKALAARHEVIALQVRDPGESLDLVPFLVRYRDLEGGASAVVDGSSSEVRRCFSKEIRFDTEERERSMRSIGVSLVSVGTDKDYVRTLIDFFKRKRL